MLEIKLFTECQENIDYLAKLQYAEITRHWVSEASIETVKQKLIQHLNQNSMPLTYVALLNKVPIGMASLRENDGIRKDLTPWLGSLVVDPAFRKNNVGEKLIAAIKAKAIQFGYNTLYLLAFDPTIPQWYSKLGWEIIGTDYLFSHRVTVMKTLM